MIKKKIENASKTCHPPCAYNFFQLGFYTEVPCRSKYYFCKIYMPKTISQEDRKEESIYMYPQAPMYIEWFKSTV